MRTLFFIGILAIAATACSDDALNESALDGAVPLDGGGGLLDARAPDGSEADGGVSQSILARASSNDYDCGVTQDLLNYKPLTWGYQGHDLSAVGTSTWVARVQADAPNTPFDPGDPSFVVSSIDHKGKLGASIMVAGAEPRLVSKPVIVALEAGAFALLWKESKAMQGMPESDTSMLRYATFDGDGKITHAVQTLLTETAALTTSLRVARATGGQLGVLWTSGSYGGTSPTRLMVVDAAGQMIAAPRVLTDRGFNASEIVADGSGFAVLYQNLDTATQRSDVLFARFDAAGAPVAQAARLTASSTLRKSSGLGYARLALLRSGEHYLAAWSEGDPGGEDFSALKGAYRVLRVARLDASGGVVSSALVRDVTDSVDEDEPVLTAFGDSVALSWGRASHIYICAGCEPDHTVELVLLDPVTLSPRSNVAKVTAAHGGLLNKHVAVQGSSLLTTLEITFHVHGEPGFTSFQCTAK